MNHYKLILRDVQEIDSIKHSNPSGIFKILSFFEQYGTFSSDWRKRTINNLGNTANIEKLCENSHIVMDSKGHTTMHLGQSGGLGITTTGDTQNYQSKAKELGEKLVNMWQEKLMPHPEAIILPNIGYEPILDALQKAEIHYTLH